MVRPQSAEVQARLGAEVGEFGRFDYVVKRVFGGLESRFLFYYGHQRPVTLCRRNFFGILERVAAAFDAAEGDSFLDGSRDGDIFVGIVSDDLHFLLRPRLGDFRGFRTVPVPDRRFGDRTSVGRHFYVGVDVYIVFVPFLEIEKSSQDRNGNFFVLNDKEDSTNAIVLN